MDLAPSTPDLPTGPTFIDQLIHELSSIQPDPLASPQTQTQVHQHQLRSSTSLSQTRAQNALSRLSPTHAAKVKPLLLTLHCVFPNDVLPALDILDRGLVQRVGVDRTSGGEEVERVVHPPNDEQSGSVRVPQQQQQQQQQSLDEPQLEVSDTATCSIPDPRTLHTPQGVGEQDHPQPDVHVHAPAPHRGRERRGSVFLVTSTSSAAAAPAPQQPSTLFPTSTPSPKTPLRNPTPTPSIHSHPPPSQVYEVRLQAWNCTCATFILSAFRNLPSRQSIADPNTKTTSPRPARVHSHGQDDVEKELRFASATGYPFGGTLTSLVDRETPPVCKHLLACLLFVRCPGLFRDGGFMDLRVSREELAGWCAGWGG
ncbi:hypothetical protein N7539_007111 [Penicillium diatomitis]|uniref:SWIM-type domain-containing protein n=1 Tax=Penicillium diatomitis TaxID=2819901 RepID=A0A9W9WUL5_9EURO|nr:uncharacterized protein N7539_007111 [Penicillium diatomitis]KAJ5476967.1 hypothetical protein N7539_007111 [Penicillium diatomitis]